MKNLQYTFIAVIYLTSGSSLTLLAQMGSLDRTFGLYGKTTVAIGKYVSESA